MKLQSLKIRGQENLCINYCRCGKNIITDEKSRLFTATGGPFFNDRIAAKTTIDFLNKYTAPLKIQLIKRKLQIAAAEYPNTLMKQRQFTLAFALTDEQGNLGFFQFLTKLTLFFFPRSTDFK